MKNKTEELLHISQLLRETDDKKYMLLKCIYELPDISYNRGSIQNDYEIRDRARELYEKIDDMYNMLKLFDNGKNGDMKAYEDILIFFQNSFIDTFVLMDKLAAIKADIGNRLRDDCHKVDGASVSNTLVHVEEYERKLKFFETRIQYEIAPRLRMFLTDVNRLLLYEKIRFYVDNSLAGTVEKIITRKMEGIKKIVTTFLWIHFKINPRDFTRTSIRDFIKESLMRLGLYEFLSSKLGFGSTERLEVLMDDTAGEFEQPPISGEVCTGGEPACLDVVTGMSAVDETEETVSRLMALVNELCSMGVEGKGEGSRRHDTGYNLKDNRGGRHLFHEPGTFSVTLRTAAEYLNDSLIFVVTCLVREIRKTSITVEAAGPLIRCMTYAEEFVDIFKYALDVAADPGNRSISVLGGEVREYVTTDLAAGLKRSILDLCDRMDGAFVECYIGIDNNSLGGKGVLLKKLKIIHDSFSNASIKVSRVLEKIKG